MEMKRPCAAQTSTSPEGASPSLQIDAHVLSSGCRSITPSGKIPVYDEGRVLRVTDFLQEETMCQAGHCAAGTCSAQKSKEGTARGVFSKSHAETLPTYAYYVVTSDGDDYMAPNVFRIPRKSSNVTLRDVKDFFPLPGTYHFRFKVPVAEEQESPRANAASNRRSPRQESFVWLDILEDFHLLPLYDNHIHIKATRLSWEQETCIEAPVVEQGLTTKTGAAITLDETDNGRRAAALRSQHRVSPIPSQKQEHAATDSLPQTSQAQLLPAGHCERASLTAAPVCVTGPLQQHQTQRSPPWEPGGKILDTAAPAMLLFDEDSPTSRDATFTGKGSFDIRSGTSGTTLDLMF